MFAIFLLVLLFLIGFINTIFHIPPKKLFLWIQSFILNNPKQDYFKEDKEEKNIKKMSNNGVINGTIDDKKSLRNRDLERVFATFDKNGDGFITKEELRDSLKNIGFFTSESEVGIMVGNLDVNGDGLIDIEEFYELYESIMGKKNKKEKVEKVEEDQEEEEEEEDEEDELREAFHVFDGDKDGLISVEELSTVLKSLGLKQGIRFEECKEMIKKVDMDGDGMVSFDEFKLMMKSGTNLVQLVS